MRTMRLFSLAIVSLLLVALVYAATHSSRNEPQNGVGVINRTKAFEVLKADRGIDELTLNLKNQDVRKITAFSVSVGPRFTITEEMIFSEVIDDVGIKPKEVFSKTYPLPLSLQQTSFDVIIKAVVLDDGTGDGDVFAYQDIKEARLGQAIQIRRGLKILQDSSTSGLMTVVQLKADLTRALQASDSDTLKNLLELEPAGIINRNSNGPFSDKLKEGLENGRQNVLRRISELDAPNNREHGLVKIKQTYKRILSRL